MTEQKKNPEDFLPDCMEQKLILLTKISDITKQIEVRSRQKEINLGNLANQRQLYIDRLKKCQQMIESACRCLPPERQERRRKILSGQFAEEECTPDEAKLLALEKECRVILQKTLSVDVEARERLQKECDRLQKLLHSARKSSKNGYSKNG